MLIVSIGMVMQQSMAPAPAPATKVRHPPFRFAGMDVGGLPLATIWDAIRVDHLPLRTIEGPIQRHKKKQRDHWKGKGNIS